MDVVNVMPTGVGGALLGSVFSPAQVLHRQASAPSGYRREKGNMILLLILILLIPAVLLDLARRSK